MAYFISSYGPPEQLRRLLRTLRAGDASAHLVVHHDVFQNPIDPSVVEEFGGHLITSPQPIVWGDLSLDRSRERVYRWALEHLDFDWLVVLSEQDYPLAPLAELAARLRASSADAVIEVEPIDEVVDPALAENYRRRYLYQHRSVPQWLMPPDDAARGGLRRRLVALIERPRFVHSMPPGLGLTPKIGHPAPWRSPFRGDRKAYAHSAWFALSHRGVQRLVELMESEAGVMRWFARTVIPVESLTATLLCNAPDVTVENQSLHHIRWSDTESGRPDVFTEADLPELLGSGAWFARKVSLAHAGLLDRLDEHVLNAPSEESFVEEEVS